MRRIRKHRIKEEQLAASSSNKQASGEQDLAYFIHDRVELMHQVFSVLKSKELKALAPECVRRLSTDDLQELCLEELLGISSKRLCAILDGAEPPSDTESSSQSPEHLETISLDSISSDEEILSQGGKKKKKHRHAKKKRRKKSKSSDTEAPGKEGGETRAARAGLTVLELLELQARARAIRAQLHQEPARVQSEPTVEARSSDNDEVEIKEEPAEVVEISSDEDKPDRVKLEQQIGMTTVSQNEETLNNVESQTVTKKINNLVITVPQSKPTRKIRLKRQKPTERAEVATKENDTPNNVENKEKSTVVVQSEPSIIEDNNKNNIDKDNKVAPGTAEAKTKAKKNKKKKKKAKDKEGSDQDEITLQLSDSEKMDLLEDLDAKNLDNVTSSGSDSSDDDHQVDGSRKQEENDEADMSASQNKNNEETVTEIVSENKDEIVTEESNKDAEIRGYISNDNNDTVEINDLPVIVDEVTEVSENATATKAESPKDEEKPVSVDKERGVGEENAEISNENTNDTAADGKIKSDGEISDRESSEVEASDVQQEVVCISDDEKKKRKKKKKDKKSKKEKKKSDFRESDDENFYKDEKAKLDSNNIIEMTIDDDDDDVYEILEISDDSSCYEVEGVSVLSKEPTAEEIEAFSAKMDEIEIDRVQTVITNDKEATEVDETCDAENVSWKDRYLGSKKVRRVLTTSNILNAIRKKNIELKKKLEVAKNLEKIEKGKQNEEENKPEEEVPALEDGSIEQYETLQGSTKYVDPVKEIEPNDKEANEATEKADDKTKGDETETEGNTVTREMKKDAKMLLKMYKRLLKYNDVNKQKDPSKKKKKKQKKNKDKVKGAV